MGASPERIRKSMSVKETPRNKGLVLDLHLVAYDNGMIELDGIPINVKERDGSYDDAAGWLGAATVALETMFEFRQQVEARRARLGERQHR